MNLTPQQTEKLRRLANSVGPQLTELFELLIKDITDIRNKVEVRPEIENEVRLLTAKMLQDLVDRVKLLSGKEDKKSVEEFT